MDKKDLKALLEKRGLRLVVANHGESTIEKGMSDDVLGVFITEIENEVILEYTSKKSVKAMPISSFVDKIQYDLNTIRIEQTEVGAGKKHNQLVMSILESVWDSVQEHSKDMGD